MDIPLQLSETKKKTIGLQVKISKLNYGSLYKAIIWVPSITKKKTDIQGPFGSQPRTKNKFKFKKLFLV